MSLRMTARTRLAACLILVTLIVTALPWAGRTSVALDSLDRLTVGADSARAQTERPALHRVHRAARSRAITRTAIQLFTRVVCVDPIRFSGPDRQFSTRSAALPPQHSFQPSTAPRAPALLDL